ncbi:MAG: RidA family protein [Rhodospirillaceae bacterium]|nr:MAG: RidA family protein [Rhodospirillaceae bacterium]
MAGIVEHKLRGMGLALPESASPKVAKILNWKRSGNLLFVSGQVPRVNGEISWIGKVGREYSLEHGQEAARDSALMVLACIKEAVGDLDNVREVVSIKGYMNVDPDFTDLSACLNGASELFIELFGDSGRHSRTAIGAASMPFGVAIEVEGIFEVE